jgi:hypothetical protein
MYPACCPQCDRRARECAQPILQIAWPLTDRTGTRSIAAVGFVVVAAATVPFCWVGATSDDWLLALWLLIRGVGLGAVTMPIMTAAYVGLDRFQIANSSVLTRTPQLIGGSFDTAVLAVILEQSISGAGENAVLSGFHTAFWWPRDSHLSRQRCAYGCWNATRSVLPTRPRRRLRRHRSHGPSSRTGA